MGESLNANPRASKLAKYAHAHVVSIGQRRLTREQLRKRRVFAAFRIEKSTTDKDAFNAIGNLLRICEKKDLNVKGFRVLNSTRLGYEGMQVDVLLSGRGDEPRFLRTFQNGRGDFFDCEFMTKAEFEAQEPLKEEAAGNARGAAREEHGQRTESGARRAAEEEREQRAEHENTGRHEDERHEETSREAHRSRMDPFEEYLEQKLTSERWNDIENAIIQLMGLEKSRRPERLVLMAIEILGEVLCDRFYDTSSLYERFQTRRIDAYMLISKMPVEFRPVLVRKALESGHWDIAQLAIVDAFKLPELKGNNEFTDRAVEVLVSNFDGFTSTDSLEAYELIERLPIEVRPTLMKRAMDCENWDIAKLAIIGAFRLPKVQWKQEVVIKAIETLKDKMEYGKSWERGEAREMYEDIRFYGHPRER